jgi:hypothetical protein
MLELVYPLRMSPKAKTALLLSVNFVLGMTVILVPRLAPSLPAYASEGATALLMLVALASVLHVPAAAVSVIQALIAALQSYATPPPAPESEAVVADRASAGAKAIASAKALLKVAVMLLCLGGAGAALAGSTSSCTPVPVSPTNVISDVASCAIDVVEDITIAPTPALLAQTVATCGIAANDLYQDISALIRNAQTSPSGDGGSVVATVTTRKGAVVVSTSYVQHLQSWQVLFADGGAGS